MPRGLPQFKINGMRILSRALLLCLLAAAVALTPREASAGRRAFGFAFDTETLNSGDVEIEQWTWARVKPPAPRATTAWLWAGPVFGLARCLEVALPWELAATASQTSLSDFAVDARILLFDRLAAADRFIRPMLRVVYQFNFANPANRARGQAPWLGANLVTSFGDTAGSHATLDVGYLGDAPWIRRDIRVHTLGAGYAHVLMAELRAGAEYFHEISLNPDLDNTRAHFAGPTLAFSRGGTWITTATLFGLNAKSPNALARVIFGAAL